MFTPKYQITQEITKYLMSIAGNKEAIKTLPVNAKILASLRETAKLMTTHHSKDSLVYDAKAEDF